VIVLSVAVVVTGGVTAWTLLQNSTFSATSRVLVGPSDAQVTGSSGDVISLDEVATQRVVATSQPVLAAAAKALGGGVTPTQLSSAMSVQPDPGTRVLAFTVETTDAKKSAQWANAVANAFVAYQDSQAVTRNTASRQQLSGLSATLETRLATIKRRLGRPGKAGDTTLQAEQRALQTQIGQVSAQLQALSAPPDGSTAAQTLDAATVPAHSTSRPLLNVVLGLILGLLLGVALALLANSVEAANERRRLA
jgi:capsular polysaccharide biosynthesis protein